jgi:SAM-dependent methyltransferase
LLENILAGLGKPLDQSTVLDVGCGTGYALGRLQQLGAEVAGVEISEIPIQIAQSRGIKRIFGAHSESMPFADEQFDMAISLDVFEHIEDDLAAMQEVKRVLTRDGHLVVFVPAMPVLWSRCDEMQGHKRRYAKAELKKKLETAGFTVDRLTFLFPTFFFPALCIRTLNRLLLSEEKGLAAAHREYDIPAPWLNALLRQILRAESVLVSKINFPFGITLAAVARKSE